MKNYFVACKTRKYAISAMPWAAKIVKVDGGYMGFEFLSDFLLWKKQT